MRFRPERTWDGGLPRLLGVVDEVPWANIGVFSPMIFTESCWPTVPSDPRPVEQARTSPCVFGCHLRVVVQAQVSDVVLDATVKWRWARPACSSVEDGLGHGGRELLDDRP